MMGETLTGIHWKHPFSPSAPEDVGDLNLEEAFSPRPDPAPGMGMPVEEPSDQPTGHSANFCYIPGLDFLLIQNFNYGLDQDGFWKFKVGLLSQCLLSRYPVLPIDEGVDFALRKRPFRI